MRGIGVDWSGSDIPALATEEIGYRSVVLNLEMMGISIYLLDYAFWKVDWGTNWDGPKSVTYAIAYDKLSQKRVTQPSGEELPGGARKVRRLFLFFFLSSSPSPVPSCLRKGDQGLGS